MDSPAFTVGTDIHLGAGEADDPWLLAHEATHVAQQQGVATGQVTGDKVYILYRDAGAFLFEGTRRGDKSVGRYVNIINPGDSSPWVGSIVNNHRIDGFWGRGRWDFRRCSPDERPEPIVAAVLTEARQLPPAALRELLGFARYLRWKADSRSAS